VTNHPAKLLRRLNQKGAVGGFAAFRVDGCAEKTFDAAHAA
jgi:hypothetical protein